MAIIPKLSSHHRKALILLVIIVVLTIAQPFLWRTVLKNADGLQDKKSQQEQISSVNERADGMIQALTKQRDALSQIDAVIVPANKVTQMVEKAEKIADELNVDITISAITEPDKSSVATNSIFPASGTSLALTQITLSLQLTGPIDSVLRYLDRIEHLAEFTIVPSWSIKPAVATTQAGPAATPTPALINSSATSFILELDVIFFVSN